MPQLIYFQPMTLEAFQAYMNFWYAQTQAQSGQGQYLVPPMATVAQPQKQYVVKLSKLIKKARQLGCQTFFGTIDAVAAKNWLKRISDILTDMKLDDELKLRVATRLINKSTATWYDNLKLRSTALVTLDLFIQEFNKQYYTHFHRDHKGQEFFKLKQFGRSVTEYETELRELAEFVSKLASS